MTRYLLLLAASLALIAVSVIKAIPRSEFSLWEAGYYLGGLGVLLCLGKIGREAL